MLLLCLLLQDVRAELEKLGSPELEVRQAAETALVAMGEAAIPEIERLAATADAETRGRAADVVRRLRWWDHTVFWRGRRIDLRRGTDAPSDFGVHARLVGGRIVDVAPGRARAVDLRSGREFWVSKLELDGEVWGVETGESSVVIRTPAGLACIDAADGRPLWQVRESWPRAAALGRDWIVQDAAGVVRRGAVSWRAERQGAIAAAGPWALVSGGSSTAVLDASTGALLRTIDELRAQRAEAAGEGCVLVVGDRELSAWRTSDGSRLWIRPQVGGGSRLLVEGRRVYVADHMGMCCSIKLYALDVETGALLWTAPARGIPASHSKYRHDARLERVGPYLALLGASSGGDYVEAFDPETGALVSRWTSR